MKGLGAALLVLLLASSASAGTLAPATIPQSAKEPAGFVPDGWKVEAQNLADLDGDGRQDVILELIQKREPEELGERSRALVIALADAKGGFARVGVGPDVLLCQGCAGMLGTMEERESVITVEKNVIVINELSGSRVANNFVLRLRYDSKMKRVRVIGRDETTYDRAAGGSLTVSENYLTGKRVVSVEDAEKFEPDALGVPPKAGSSKGSPKTIWLEDAHIRPE